MSKAFKLGIADGKVSRNPARLVPQRKESNGRVRFLSEEEEKRLRAALAGRPNCIPQLEVALHTGMRKGEQFTVTWGQVDFENRYIHLSQTKNGSDRYVALNSTAMRALKSLEKTHDRLKLPPESLLFLSHQNKPMTDPKEWFGRACEEAKDYRGYLAHSSAHFCKSSGDGWRWLEGSAGANGAQDDNDDGQICPSGTRP